ncbi:TetR/AcrR family transcriptional regulator [Rhodococcus globerulus]|uniref:TetR/AcrR family transcriptional regulator n=1 Tax=Rhodococcus globerulus TaxID=33008 RepID=UPI000A7A3189|nr:TetR/AcrR family transcriptional regulator [Rhodococcus globerulus]
MRPRTRSEEKRQAVTDAARKVFGRDGFARTSIDAIASEAGVSTRTIYNHFEGKDQLFAFVIEESAGQVANSQEEMITRYLIDVSDVATSLIDLGCAWVSPPSSSEFSDHFAMVRQIDAEAAHVPRAALDAWQEAGPRRAHRALAEAFERLARDGQLRTGDGRRAARHFIQLVGSEVEDRSEFGAVPLGDQEVRAAVTAGVEVFLYGYSPRE